MSPASTRYRAPVRSARKKKSRMPGWVIVLFPLLIGIVITPFAVRAASILAMSGPTALRLLYPYVVIAQSHLFDVTTDQKETLSQWVMYGQFPFYGLVWILARALSRGAGGPLAAVAVHCVGVGAAIFIMNG